MSASLPPSSYLSKFWTVRMTKKHEIEVLYPNTLIPTQTRFLVNGPDQFIYSKWHAQRQHTDVFMATRVLLIFTRRDSKLFICSVAVAYHGRAHLKMDIYRLAGDQNCFSNINPRNSRHTH